MLRQPALLALLLTVFVGRANALTYMAGYEPLNDMTERAEMDLDLVAMIGTPSTDSWMLGGECGASCSLSAACGSTVYASGTGCEFTSGTLAWPEGSSAYLGTEGALKTAYTIWKYGYQSDAGARNFYGFANAMTAGKSSGSGTDMRENKFMKIMNTYWAFKGLGQYSWPVEMIAGAFEGNTVGAVNFATVGRDYRVQAIKKGTVYMNVFPYIIWELQDAANDCRSGAWASERGKAWDEALTFYTGSTIGTSYATSSTGKLGYALADKRCQNFKTCANDFDGISKVNEEILALFIQGKEHAKASPSTDDCNMIEHLGDRIIGQMLIPLVQGTVRYLYKTSEAQSSKEAGELWAFATAILPFVHNVDPDAAARLYARAWSHDFSEPWTDVRGAIEGTYGGMGAGDGVGQVSCEAVGDLYDESETLISAGGCYGEVELEDWEIALIVLGTIALVSFLGCGAYAIWSHVKKQRVQKKYDQLLISKTGAMMPVTV